MPPPAELQDRCWGVPVVATFSAFLVFLPPSSAGLLYVLFMGEFGITHEMAAWPQSTYTVMSNSIGLVQSVVQQRVPLYHLTLFGVGLTCAGLVACAFSPDIVWMAALYGGVYGAGAGISMISLSLYLLLYFDKYRGTATAFKYTGWAASGIVGPTLIGYIAEHYGAQGALLFIGAMAMHALPLVMLLSDPQPVTIPAWCVRKPAKGFSAPVAPNVQQCITKGAELTPKRLLLTRRYVTNGEANKEPVTKDKAMEKETTKHDSGKILVTDVTKLDETTTCSPNSSPPVKLCREKACLRQADEGRFAQSAGALRETLSVAHVLRASDTLHDDRLHVGDGRHHHRRVRNRQRSGNSQGRQAAPDIHGCGPVGRSHGGALCLGQDCEQSLSVHGREPRGGGRLPAPDLPR
ncbi:uncharacterized protein LOC119445998 [Dermacentor silvarum]|uniref:uncharacterized protein LOC119445998 n=1 Tax=Dermacentor silvarum TaxID=543639 RepID=UPI001898E415|nr:uncharacterized protein LOC119445998 [Dermacentor silvarum]